MTVSTETKDVSYAGNGVTTSFAVPFYILLESHINVILRASSGAESVKSLNTDYTVANAGTNPSTASITCTTFIPAIGETLLIKRNVPLTQETDYVENDSFPAESHEKALDKLTMLIQQVNGEAGRALRIPATSAASTELPNPSANKVITVNSSATGFQYSDYVPSVAAGDWPVISSIASLRLQDKTAISNAFVSGYYAAGDGGGGHYYYDAADTTSTDNGGTIIVGADGGRWKLLHNGVVDVRQAGIKLDGATDASAAFLVLLQLSTVKEIIGRGTMALSSVVSATLTSSKKISKGLVIKWTGSATSGVMVTVNCSGFDFEYDAETDGDNLISAGWLIENSTVITADLPKCVFKGKTKKFRATAAAAFNNNAYIRGSFDLVQVSDGEHSETSRAAGLGAATQTIVVDKKTTSLYPKVIKHFNNTYFGIASSDTGAADIDTDYFVCTMPDPTNFPNGGGTNGYPNIAVESYGNTYFNPIGRCEKFQCVPNTHDNLVVRNGDTGSRTMFGSSVDFNLQWGVGECRNQTVYLKGSTTSPITTDYVPVSYFQGSDYGERRGSVTCSDIIIYNQISTSLGRKVAALVGLQLNATSAAKPFGTVDIKNIFLRGGTADHTVIMGYDAGGVGSVVIDNIEADFNFNPIAIQTACPDIRLTTKNITNTNATSRLLINDVGGGSRAFTGSSFGYNYIGITQSYEFGATYGPASQLSGAALCDQSANKNSGGALSVQSKFLADDALHTFGVRGFTKGNHIIMVSSSYASSAAQCLFACTGASGALVKMSAHGTTDIVTGTGSNPDTDTKLNIWVDANGAVNIKNRLGSGYAFTIAYLG